MFAPTRWLANALPPDFGPEELAGVADVSRETLARLKSYVGLLEDWSTRHNLVSAASLVDVWRRHVWDSAQVAPFIPKGSISLVDLGSGAGFPGLVLAILLRGRPGFRTVLYEATRKKCEFLDAAAKAADVSVDVRHARIEDANAESFDVVTARACAPLTRLLSYAKRFQGPHTTNLFFKGRSVDVELTEAHKSWRMSLVRHQSQTDPSGTILEIREFARVAPR